MDARTHDFLSALNLEAEEKFGKKLYRTKKDGLVAMVEALLVAKGVTKEQKRKLQFLRERKLLGKEEHTIVDDQIQKELKKFFDTRIESAISSGRIPAPDLAEYERVCESFKRNR
jgi:hypothetical protein